MLIDLFLTAIIYGLAPIILLVFRKTSISRKKLMVFHIVYTFSIALGIKILLFLAGEEIGSFAPAFLWGYIFYRINLSQFKKRGILAEPKPDTSVLGCSQPETQECHLPLDPLPPASEDSPTEEDIPAESIPAENVSFPAEPEQTQTAIPQKCIRVFFVLIFAVLLIISTCIIFLLYSKNLDLQNELNELQGAEETISAEYHSLQYKYDLAKTRYNNILNEYNDIVDEYSAIVDEYNFYHNYAVIVTETGKRYHQYGCYHVNYGSFLIYNIDAAKYYGYTPCKDCCYD